MLDFVSAVLVNFLVTTPPLTANACVVFLWARYFFGGGICVTAVGAAMPMPPCEILEVGRTSKTEAQLTAFLSSITNQFTAATYDLLNHNCNHFSNAVVRFLCVSK